MPTPSQNWFHEFTDDSYAVGYRITGHLDHCASPYQTVDIYETARHGNMLVLDGCIMLTEAHEFTYHEMLVHVPLLAHPNPEQILVIGGGDGGSVREVLRHDVVKHVDMVEIDEEVVNACRRFLPALSGRLDDPKVSLIFQDAVEFIKDKESRYDVVLVDSTDPIGPGEGLFSRSFYRDVLRSLKSKGIVAAQSESPFFLKDEVGKIYRKLKTVFPLVSLYWAPVPSYPYGTWSFAFCSKEGSGPEIRRTVAAENIEKDCRYYNRAVHLAAFVLPNFMRGIVLREE